MKLDPKRCVFCDIVEGKAPASVVYADEIATAFMDIQPVNVGHVLVVPNRHASCLADVDDRAAAHLFVVAKRMAAALRACGIRCEGINLFLADGKEAFQEVFHVHIHVLPRYAGDGFGLRFGPAYGHRPSRAELDSLAARIRETGGWE